jgi:hypothetical protein
MIIQLCAVRTTLQTYKKELSSKSTVDYHQTVLSEETNVSFVSYIGISGLIMIRRNCCEV